MIDGIDDAPPAYEAGRTAARRLPSTRGPRPRPVSCSHAPAPSLSHDTDLSSASSSSASESAVSEKRRVAGYFIANDSPVPEPVHAATPPASWDAGVAPLRPRRRALASIPEPAPEIPAISVMRTPTLPPAYVPHAPGGSRAPPRGHAHAPSSSSPSASTLHFSAAPPLPLPSPSLDHHLRPYPPRHSSERRSLYEEPPLASSHALPPSHALGLAAPPSTVNTKAHNFYNSAIAAQLRPLGDTVAYDRHVPTRVASASPADHSAAGYVHPHYSSFSTSSAYPPEAAHPALASSQASTYTSSVYRGR